MTSVQATKTPWSVTWWIYIRPLLRTSPSMGYRLTLNNMLLYCFLYHISRATLKTQASHLYKLWPQLIRYKLYLISVAKKLSMNLVSPTQRRQKFRTEYLTETYCKWVCCTKNRSSMIVSQILPRAHSGKRVNLAKTTPASKAQHERKSTSSAQVVSNTASR